MRNATLNGPCVSPILAGNWLGFLSTATTLSVGALIQPGKVDGLSSILVIIRHMSV